MEMYNDKEITDIPDETDKIKIEEKSKSVLIDKVEVPSLKYVTYLENQILELRKQIGVITKDLYNMKLKINSISGKVSDHERSIHKH